MSTCIHPKSLYISSGVHCATGMPRQDAADMHVHMKMCGENEANKKKHSIRDRALEAKKDHYIARDSNRRVSVIRPPKRLFNIRVDKDGYKEVSFMTIADLDGRLMNEKANSWNSPSARGVIKYKYDKATSKAEFQIKMADPIVYEGKMVCDRTGTLYWMHGRKPVPWVVYADGNGTSEKPFKTEWMLIKDGKLMTGGYGREWAEDDGSIDPMSGYNALYIKVINKHGEVKHVNWKRKFHILRSKIGISADPNTGYLVHESAQWSKIHKKYFFLPRKISHEAFKESVDERSCGKMMFTANSSFTMITKTDINTDNRPVAEQDFTRGFSAFQFMPETNDEVIVALKTVEIKNQPMETYITIFNINGKVHLPEMKLDGDFKYEGIEFIDWQHGYWNQNMKKD
uniref:Apyrase n=1 Tax=Ditylenchus dipsaci TaxID=166011 RepID=A0A915DZG3_9BILA